MTDKEINNITDDPITEIFKNVKELEIENEHKLHKAQRDAEAIIKETKLKAENERKSKIAKIKETQKNNFEILEKELADYEIAKYKEIDKKIDAFKKSYIDKQKQAVEYLRTKVLNV